MYGLGYLYFSNNLEVGEFSLNVISMYFRLWFVIFSLEDNSKWFGGIGALIVFLIFLYLHVLIYQSWNYIGAYLKEEFRKEGKHPTNTELENEIINKAKGKNYDEIE
jgi:uncharacterized BrkB/YihY/UPF0761 family membrane protein|tara:strand:+ start:192 stop:512 length:321 start_codon:yes stop_codon:yes gene_type:complete